MSTLFNGSPIGNTTNAGLRRYPSNGIDYPVRFFNMLHFQKPNSKREMFLWAARMSESHGILARIIDTYSRYPITTIEVTGDDCENKNFWSKTLNDTLGLCEELVINGKDYYTYGNCFVSIVAPFERYLKCTKCGSYLDHNISERLDALQWKFHDFKFIGTCKTCKHQGVMVVVDEYLKTIDNIEKIRVHRWPIQHIEVKDIPIAGRKKIFYKLENKYLKGIRSGDKFMVSVIPINFIEAVKLNSRSPTIELVDSLTYHYKHEDLTEAETDGLAQPFFMAAWKDTFMCFVLRKAQECIVAEHMVPRKFIYPQQQGTTDPLAVIHGDDWRNVVQVQLRRMQNDPNEIGIMPYPLGYQQIGGDGKALSITDIMEYQDRRLLVQLGCPPELVYGGMTYSGANVALRMLENNFAYYVRKQEKFLNFIAKAISRLLSIDAPEHVKLAPFRMADDQQMSATLQMLGAQNRISETTALSGVIKGIDLEAEAKQSEKDLNAVMRIMSARQKANNLAMQYANRDATIVANQNAAASMQQQQDLQQTANSAIGNPIVYVDPTYQAEQLARIAAPERARMLLQAQASLSPERYQQLDRQMSHSPLPQPEQKPPTRKTG